LPAQTAKKQRNPKGRTGFVLLLHGLKVGFAHFQTQINPAKSRVLLFDEHLSVMSLTLEQVRRIAELARIEISDAEAGNALGHLNRIFSLIEEMQAVDTRGVEPMAHAQDLAQRLREDKVTETDRREDYQAVAPETEGGLYLVPKVIE
jgi:aspartyl-tRNA(Asn)/glutamyl-tRNA(Gln) amidotransferase subunit C